MKWARVITGGFLALFATATITQAAYGVDFFVDCKKFPNDATCQDARKTTGREASASLVRNIIMGLIYLVGALSVIMIVYGGVQYIISAGNQDKLRLAKSTIMYAVVGLVVALLAYAIVSYVAGRLK